MTKEKQVPADRDSPPVVMQRLRLAVFQLSQSSLWEKMRLTTFSGAMISISSLMTVNDAPIIKIREAHPAQSASGSALFPSGPYPINRIPFAPSRQSFAHNADAIDPAFPD
jgi:hypothetical protein